MCQILDSEGFFLDLVQHFHVNGTGIALITVGRGDPEAHKVIAVLKDLPYPLFETSAATMDVVGVPVGSKMILIAFEAEA